MVKTRSTLQAYNTYKYTEQPVSQNSNNAAHIQPRRTATT